MTYSMTGYAALEQGHGVGDSFWTASWDIRSVNAKGLDLRVRVPDWVTGLEPVVRKQITGALGRGSITVSLKLSRPDGANLGLNSAALDAALQKLKNVEQAAEQQGISLASPTALDVLSMRGVAEQQDLSQADTLALSSVLQNDLPILIESFIAARATEGASLHAVLTSQIDDIENLCAQALETSLSRADAQKRALSEALSRITGAVDVAEDRMFQELAVLATKADVTEELDRLTAHVAMARELLSLSNPVGRKLDFLCQEFNREANTLCSKSGDTGLTRIGLELKTRIEQLREQVQNVE